MYLTCFIDHLWTILKSPASNSLGSGLLTFSYGLVFMSFSNGVFMPVYQLGNILFPFELKRRIYFTVLMCNSFLQVAIPISWLILNICSLVVCCFALGFLWQLVLGKITKATFWSYDYFMSYIFLQEFVNSFQETKRNVYAVLDQLWTVLYLACPVFSLF